MGFKDEVSKVGDKVSEGAEEVKAGWLGLSAIAHTRIIWFGVGFLVALFVVWIFKG